MQTQCPHCKSQYNIGADLVEAYGGFVRCGNCNYKFNIHDQVSSGRHQDDIQDRKEPQFDPSEEHSSQATQRIEPKIGADGETDDDSLNIRFRELEDEYAADIAYEPVLRSELEAFDDELALQESAPVFTSITETEIDIETDEIDLSKDNTFDNNYEPALEPLDSPENDELPTPENLDDFKLDGESLIDNLAQENYLSDEVSSELPQTDDQKQLSDEWQVEADSEDDIAHADETQDETDSLPGLFDDTDIQEDVSSEPLDNIHQQDLDNDWEAVEDVISDPDVLDDDTDSLADLFDETDEAIQEYHDDSVSRPIIFDPDPDAEQEYVDDSRQAPRIPSLINDDTESTVRAKSFGLVSAFMRMLMFMFWTAISITLVYFLFSQIKDRLYPGYINHPVVQSIRTRVCEVLPCSETKYDTQAYEIVVSRMDEKSAPDRELHISVFMMNKSNISQVYPKILVTLKRLDGSIAGQRAITPDEYFKSHDSFVGSGGKAAPERQIIKPGKLGKVLIKLDNPPADAVGFEAQVVN